MEDSLARAKREGAPFRQTQLSCLSRKKKERTPFAIRKEWRGFSRAEAKCHEGLRRSAQRQAPERKADLVARKIEGIPDEREGKEGKKLIKPISSTSPA